jgi:L-2,4-diaminobutyric acid acetyltransferase
MITLRRAGEADLGRIRSFVAGSPPLDLHTPYTYWVLLHWFSDYCFIAEEEEELAGFLTALPVPDSGIFIWQIGVAHSFRGQGVGTRLLKAAADEARKRRAGWICFSIENGNAASLGLFRSFALSTGQNLEEMCGLELPAGTGGTFKDETLYGISL